MREIEGKLGKKLKATTTEQSIFHGSAISAFANISTFRNEKSMFNNCDFRFRIDEQERKQKSNFFRHSGAYYIRHVLFFLLLS